jgi:hypothetical protein
MPGAREEVQYQHQEELEEDWQMPEAMVVKMKTAATAAGEAVEAKALPAQPVPLPRQRLRPAAGKEFACLDTRGAGK